MMIRMKTFIAGVLVVMASLQSLAALPPYNTWYQPCPYKWTLEGRVMDPYDPYNPGVWRTYCYQMCWPNVDTDAQAAAAALELKAVLENTYPGAASLPGQVHVTITEGPIEMPETGGGGY